MFVFCRLGCHAHLQDIDADWRVKQLFTSLKITDDSFFVIHNGRKVEQTCPLQNGNTYHFVPRILGGKGGFGSMLRAIGAQIEKTTSREACRDLSGRRMRDVNNEKKLKEWLSKEADREREREERRQEKLARRLAGPKHNFDDPDYHKQKSKVQEDLSDALQKGLKRAGGKSDDQSSSQAGPSKRMKSSNKEWLGVDIDSDDLDSDTDNEANPGSPNMKEMDEETSRADSTHDSSSPCSTEESNKVEKPPAAELKLVCGQDAQAKVPEVKDDDSKGTALSNNGDDEPVDLDKIKDVNELVGLGLVRLKNALISRGLKCGGTLEERSERLFSIKGLTPDQIPSSLMAKSKGGGKKSKCTN